MQYNNTYTVPYAGITIADSELVSNLKVTGNIFSGFRRKGALVVHSRRTIYNLSVDNNQFYRCGSENGTRPCCVELQQSVQGFCFNFNDAKDTGYMSYMVITSDSSSCRLL